MVQKFDNQRAAQKYEKKADTWTDIDIMKLEKGDEFRLFEADGRELPDGPFIATGEPSESANGTKTIPYKTKRQ